MLTTSQIRRLGGEYTSQESIVESEDLINLMNERGVSYVLEEVDKNENHNRIAVFTMTNQEYEDLQEFCDVLFIDSTHVPSRLQWQVLPITLISSNKTIKCGGILFTSMVTEEVVKWLFDILFQNFNFREKFRTVTTDDDNAFQAVISMVFEEYNQDLFLNHLLCPLHKRKNVKAKALTLSLSSIGGRFRTPDFGILYRGPRFFNEH